MITPAAADKRIAINEVTQSCRGRRSHSDAWRALQAEAWRVRHRCDPNRIAGDEVLAVLLFGHVERLAQHGRSAGQSTLGSCDAPTVAHRFDSPRRFDRADQHRAADVRSFGRNVHAELGVNAVHVQRAGSGEHRCIAR